MNATPTPETDAAWDGYVTPPYPLCSQDVAELCRKLERERNEAREYADKLVAHKDMVCLPKDLEVLREANLGLAVELNEARNEILGWKNKWDCAIEMGARAECERDEMTLRRNLAISLLDEECALADRLAKQLDDCLLSQEDIGAVMLALDAWKEARK